MEVKEVVAELQTRYLDAEGNKPVLREAMQQEETGHEEKEEETREAEDVTTAATLKEPKTEPEAETEPQSALQSEPEPSIKTEPEEQSHEDPPLKELTEVYEVVKEEIEVKEEPLEVQQEAEEFETSTRRGEKRPLTPSQVPDVPSDIFKKQRHDVEERMEDEPEHDKHRKRSERMQFMGEEERILLLDLINERRAVLLSKAIDARIIPVKARGWEEITNSLAVSGLGPQRTVKQVKKIWENMRARAKKFVCDQKKKLRRTGGGPPSPVFKPDLVLEKILALIPDELEPDPNHNDSDKWPTDVTVVVSNEKREQLDEPMAMTEQPSTACSVPISNHCTPLSSTSVKVPATVTSIGSKPLPSTSVCASVPFTLPSELSPIQSSSTRGKVSGKKFKAKKRQVKDSVGRESYEMLSKFQKEEHEIVMQIHKQNLENKKMDEMLSKFQKEEHEMVMQIHKQNLKNKKMEGDCLRQAMKIMSSIYSRVGDTLEDVRAAAGAFIDFLDNSRNDKA